ncbi:uncharacterized protein LOC123535230 [Mercenaria mercenaria]|uniref:uncharacterized protein LOC123535230 n=1 Tax=Mercenaria mercenaria TaxID=6596 RepID=UPI00234ECD92|nr:uncharacterized protein LOC123535230 [Mercenaria mercenaria]
MNCGTLKNSPKRKHQFTEIIFDCSWNMATINVFLLMGCLSNIHASSRSHYGKEFYIGMPSAWSSGNEVYIDIASQSKGNAFLEFPYSNKSDNRSLNKGSTTLSVYSDVFTRGGTFTEKTGIFLRTDVPVAVFVSSYKFYQAVMETYLALPVSYLGTRYKAASYLPYHSYVSEMMIIGISDNTTVTMTGHRRNTTFLTLNRSDVHQIDSKTDVSFTSVLSDKPVAVLSGSTCNGTLGPRGKALCDQLVEQMVPEHLWGETVIVPPVFPKLGFVLKVFSFDNAAVCLKNHSETRCVRQCLMGASPVLVTSNASINVVQYSVGQKYYEDDILFMTVIPGIKNYLNNYYFVVPNIYSRYANRLAIVVPSVEVGGLLLDGLQLGQAETFTVPEPFSNYTILIVYVRTGYHELYHTNKNVTFGVIAYAIGDNTGYGFPVGFGFQSGTPSANGLVEKDVHCFSCEDMGHAESCDVVKHCDENEVCYIQSYEKYGRKLYRSGCSRPDTCLKEKDSFRDTPDKCMECCSKNYCNNRGCGDNGLGGRDYRGPVCFDCPYERSPLDCNKITLCERDEICSIEEYRKWGEDSHYKMGCSSKQCTFSLPNLHEPYRGLPICQSCCTEDYCNLNCTKTYQGPSIVG